MQTIQTYNVLHTQQPQQEWNGRDVSEAHPKYAWICCDKAARYDYSACLCFDEVLELGPLLVLCFF